MQVEGGTSMSMQANPYFDPDRRWIHLFDLDQTLASGEQRQVNGLQISLYTYAPVVRGGSIDYHIPLRYRDFELP